MQVACTRHITCTTLACASSPPYLGNFLCLLNGLLCGGASRLHHVAGRLLGRRRRQLLREDGGRSAIEMGGNA